VELMKNPEWWTNRDDAEYEAAKMASNDELEVYFDDKSMAFHFFLKKPVDSPKRKGIIYTKGC
jgi:hypothetical protein